MPAGNQMARIGYLTGTQTFVKLGQELDLL